MLLSEPILPFDGTPALRKYFCARMSVATCDHDCGTSTSFISKTMLPSGFLIIDVRFSYVTLSYCELFSCVKYLLISKASFLCSIYDTSNFTFFLRCFFCAYMSCCVLPSRYTWILLHPAS